MANIKLKYKVPIYVLEMCHGKLRFVYLKRKNHARVKLHEEITNNNNK